MTKTKNDMANLLFAGWGGCKGTFTEFNSNLHVEFRLSNGDEILDIESVTIDGDHLSVVTMSGIHRFSAENLIQIITCE